ncbi:MAG: RICIN domain-containing protein, partial [Bacteroidaceae bacterium]|nr:RICIN domain-containing protein [Bacteroidaceae bacterium]
MSNNRLKQGFALTLMALFIAIGSFAQTTFVKGKLYHIYASGDKGNVVTEKKDNSVVLKDLENGNTAQFWRISELSGSWRFINPITNKALRVSGNRVEVGENNGSDEAQLWKYENGLLIPSNSPDVAEANSKGAL